MNSFDDVLISGGIANCNYVYEYIQQKFSNIVIYLSGMMIDSISLIFLVYTILIIVLMKLSKRVEQQSKFFILLYE